MSKKSFKYAQYEGIKQAADVLNSKDFLITSAGTYGGPMVLSFPGQPDIDLKKIFGAKRVMEYSAIDEIWYTAAALGSSMIGVRGINLHFLAMANAYPFELIGQHAGKLHHMTGGQCTMPVTFVLTVYGRTPGSAGQHSDYECDTWYAHMPGIKTVVPTTVYDAKGLMISAIKGGDPVVYLDVASGLGQLTEDIPDEPYEVPIGKAAIRTEGRDITIVGSGGSMLDIMPATERLQKEGINVEAIDLRTLHPLDTKTLVKSVEKTGRLLTVDWGKYTLCPGGEVIARVAEGVPGALFKRIAHPDAPVAAAPEMCSWAYPDEKNVYDAAKVLLKK